MLDLLQKTLAEQKESYDHNFEQLFIMIRNSIKTDNFKMPLKGSKFVKGLYQREKEENKRNKEEHKKLMTSIKKKKTEKNKKS